MVMNHRNNLINYSLEIDNPGMDYFSSRVSVLTWDFENERNPFYLLAGAPIEWRRKLLPYTFLLDEPKKMLVSIEPTR